MSILIKGMEMPDNCTDCWFRKTARHEYLSDCQLCPFTGDTTPYLTRDKKCPLVPVPPHGDLIDLSAKVNAQYYDDADEEWSIKTVTVEDILYGICEEMPPTIIPAEEGE